MLIRFTCLPKHYMLFLLHVLSQCGAISPKASNGHQFFLVAIDNFTKWVKTASYVSIIQSVVIMVVKKEIICRCGLLKRIITDNAKNFNNKMVEAMCSQFKTKHSNSTPYCPKLNGAVEAVNKDIKKIVDWHEKLPFALHAYRTTTRASTGATSYFFHSWNGNSCRLSWKSDPWKYTEK